MLPGALVSCNASLGGRRPEGGEPAQRDERDLVGLAPPRATVAPERVVGVPRAGRPDRVPVLVVDVLLKPVHHDAVEERLCLREAGSRRRGPLRARLDRLHLIERVEKLSKLRFGDLKTRDPLRGAGPNFSATLKTTNGTIERLDKNLVQQLPGIIDKLDATLAKLDSAAGNADSILGENRAAINSFANDGLGQLGPTLGELRGLIRDLRRVSDRLENNPARYLLGRDAPKEFEPK